MDQSQFYAIGSCDFAQSPCKAPAEAFESLVACAHSESQVRNVLGEIAGAYGKVNSISAISPIALPAVGGIGSGTEHGEYRFLVDFDRTLDAMAAANDLKCLLLGFSSLMVSVPKKAAMRS